MNFGRLFRLVSLVVLLGSAVSLVAGSGAFAQDLGSSLAPAATQAQSAAPDLPLAPQGSGTNALNWAGYVATGGTYTSVSGSWIVPTVSDTNVDNVADATWVGIGGVESNDLIQAGTEAIPDSRGGLTYQAWMETLPDDSRIVPLTISPGDAVSVSITESSQGMWNISFDDATTGKTYETSVQYDSSLSSADWVEEMPVEVGGIVGLDDFGTVRFTAGYAIENGNVVTIRSSGATPLTMDNSDGVAVATPSALGADGSSFDVIRTDAASTPLALTADGISAVPIDSSYAYSGGYGFNGYTVHVRHRSGGYRISIGIE